MPYTYQKAVNEQCGLNEEQYLKQYWDEWTKEYVCSGGRCNSGLREFPTDYSYRSHYLDELANKFNYAESPFRGSPPIYPCLHEFEIKFRKSTDFRESINALVNTEKVIEFATLNLTTDGWTGQKQAVVKLFESSLSNKGFTKKKKSDLVHFKQSSSGLIFKCFVDIGGRPNVVDTPLEFFISTKENEDVAFHVSRFENIAPGFRWYTSFTTAEFGALGIYAHIEMFDVLYHSFE